MSEECYISVFLVRADEHVRSSICSLTHAFLSCVARSLSVFALPDVARTKRFVLWHPSYCTYAGMPTCLLCCVGMVCTSGSRTMAGNGMYRNTLWRICVLVV
jgi:hypothetical protein